jgi:hypothetical protein
MTVVQDCGSVGGWRFSDYLQRCRESRRLVLVIVAIALLLDNMLLTTVGKSLLSDSVFLSLSKTAFESILTERVSIAVTL